MRTGYLTRPALRGPLGSVICEVCGRDNADDLTFCQDCGRRLTTREQRVAPPTPPSGLPKVVLPALSLPSPMVDSSGDRTTVKPTGPAWQHRAGGSRLRPEAPVFSFSQSAKGEAGAAQARHDSAARPIPSAGAPATVRDSAPYVPPDQTHNPAEQLVAPAQAAQRQLCPTCDAENPTGYRFCVTCGAPLQRKGMPLGPGAQLPAAPPLAPQLPAAQALAPQLPAAQPLAPQLPSAQPLAPQLPAAQALAPQLPAAQALAPQLPAAQALAPQGEVRPGAAGAEGPAARASMAALVPPPTRRDGLFDPEPQRAAATGWPSNKQIHPPLPPIALPPPRLPAVQAASLGADKIVGAPVVDIAATRQTPVRQVECARCHGQCVAGTRFCKYCGAPLEADRPPPPASTRPPPAPAPQRVQPQPAQGDVSTLASSVETTSSVPRPSQIPFAPLRASYSVRPPAWVPVDSREARVPEGRLVVIVEDGTEGKSFPLSGQQVDIGRSEGDILLEDDLYVSPRHARLMPQNGAWVLRDLGSVNRIYLRIRKAHDLRDGDLLLLGLEVLQFQTVSDGERGLGHAIQHGTLVFGSPAIHRRARLCQRTVEGIARDVYHLYRDETVIGRETGDIVFTSDPFLSRRHAAIRRSPTTGEFTLTDLDSSNGTYVAIREDVSLMNRDFVRIGQHLFRVDLS